MQKVEMFKGMKLPWVPWFSSLCVYFLAQTSIKSLMKFLIDQYGFLQKFCYHVDSPNILLVMANESDQIC